MNTDKLKQMYASGGLLRAILKDPKMRQMASDMLASDGKKYEEGGMMEMEETMSESEPPKYAGKKEWAMSPAATPFVAAEMERRGIGFPSDMVQSTFQQIVASNPEIGSEIIDYAFMRAADESRQRGSSGTFSGSYDREVINPTVPGYRTMVAKPSGYRD